MVPPVAEKIRAQARCRLSTVIGTAFFILYEDFQAGFSPVPFGNDISVKDFTQQVTIPPKGKIAGSWFGF